MATATIPTGFRPTLHADSRVESSQVKHSHVRSLKGFFRCVRDTGVRKSNGQARSEFERTRAQEILSDVYGTEYGRYANPQKDSAGSWIEKAADMGEDSGVAGGYITPLDYTAQLLQSAAEQCFIWKRANVVPMRSAVTECPIVDMTTASGTVGVPNMFGSMYFKWLTNSAENSGGETEPKFRQVMLRAWNLLGFLNASNDLLQDTGGEGEARLVKLIGHAAAWSAEYAFLQGTGTAQQMPLGMLNSQAVKKITRGGSSTIAAVDVAKMSAALLPGSWRTAVWATNPSCLEKIVQITQYFFNVQHESDDGCCGKLLTRPLFVTEKLPTLGTYGDLMLFDPMLYAIGERSQVVVDVSEHVLFTTYQTQFRVWLRCDGVPVLNNTVTMADNTTTCASVVALN